MDPAGPDHPVHLAVPHRPDQPRLLGRHHRVLHRPGHHRTRSGSTRSASSGSASRPSCTASTTGTRSTPIPPGSCITVISVLLFLGYARAGAWLPQQALASSPDLAPAPPGSPGHWAPGPAGHVPPAAHPGPAGYGAPAGYGSPAGHGAPAGRGAPAGYGPPAVPPAEAWWQHAPAAGAEPVPQPPHPAHASPAPADVTAPHAAASHSASAQPIVAQPTMARRKPWWEQ